MENYMASAKVMEHYQIVIPADMRKDMHINVGDILILRKEKGQIVISDVFKKKKPSLLNLVALGKAKKPTNAQDLKKRIQRGEKLHDLR